PMNGFKGFGLGLAVEILSGALIGAKCGAQVVEGFDGMFFIALDPDRLVGRTVFEDHVETLLQSIKTSRQAVVDKEILIPGERSYRMYKDNCSKDTVDLSDAVYNEMKALDS
ncbi:MAG: Ldh family oxidoreductase, partial [Alphaproteobacteria bacterium]